MCSYTNKMKYRPYTCPRKTTFVEREIPELPIVYARRLRNLHKLTLIDADIGALDVLLC